MGVGACRAEAHFVPSLSNLFNAFGVGTTANPDFSGSVSDRNTLFPDLPRFNRYIEIC